MILGVVVGTVVCTKRADNISGAKYLLVEKCDQHAQRKGEFHVVLDHVGAGRDEIVLVTHGSPNRQTERTFDKPVDASIVAIVDLIDENGTVSYRK
jgi:microcompartment protein CcmK/EutM